MVIFFKFWTLWCLLFVETRRTDGRLVCGQQSIQPVFAALKSQSSANVDVMWYKDHIHYDLYLAAASVLFTQLESLTSYTKPNPPRRRQCAKTSDFIKSNLIKNDAKELTYCYPSDKRRKRQVRQDGGHDYFDCMVNNLRIDAQDPQVLFVHLLPVQTYDTVTYPFREIILGEDIDSSNDRPISIPIYIRATILESHTHNARPQIPSHINRYLARVGSFNSPVDQAGHLLSHVLGGTTRDEFNFAPQAARLNTHAAGWSMWLGEEMAMRDFLRGGTNRRVEWELLLEHGPSSSTTTSRRRLRPIYFTLRHVNYEGNVMVNNLNQPITTPEPVLCFSNDPDEECPLIPLD